jgi:hypothetical protein
MYSPAIQLFSSCNVVSYKDYFFRNIQLLKQKSGLVPAFSKFYGKDYRLRLLPGRLQQLHTGFT